MKLIKAVGSLALCYKIFRNTLRFCSKHNEFVANYVGLTVCWGVFGHPG